MIGQKDYYVSENGAMAVCREKGVVVVKASGSGNVSISEKTSNKNKLLCLYEITKGSALG